MLECVLRGLTINLCPGKSECWCMCSGNKFGCKFWEMRVFVYVRGLSVSVLRECVLLCVFGK